ncbi:hypothetical protein P3T73_11810 [Kiritimatiellota bacterium B12222]|nr:hypothetical protein P3T73_11810 [Kiritimatiellota bacterium B12222]
MMTSHVQSYLKLVCFGFFTALLISLIITPVIMKLGFALGFVDQPDDRRIHKTPTPRCGGFGVFLAYSISIYLACHVIDFPEIGPLTREWIKAVIPVSIPLILLGLIDDRWEMKPIFKLLGQIFVACLAWQQGINLGKFLGMNFHPVIDILATVFLYVAAMNAYNLIDGMDGVAAGLATITSLGLGALNLLIGNEGMAVMCFALTGACLGFLRYNFHPARVFLGDTGSMYIGFILMSLTLVAQSRTTAAIMMIIPLLTMGVPMIDTGLAIWRRSVRKAMYPERKGKVSAADKDHLHHRLARKGLTQRRVAVTLYIIQATLFAVGLMGVFLQDYRIAIFTIAFFVGSYVILRYLAHLEMNDSGRWIVDGIRRPGRMLLFNSLLPLADICILGISLMILSWLFGDAYQKLGVIRLVRETSAPLIAGPMILIWATQYYQQQWIRARALDYFNLGLIATAGILVGIAISPLPLQHSLRETVIFSIILLSTSVPMMVFCRAFPRLVQDTMQYYDRKNSQLGNSADHRVLIYGAGYGYTLITRAESFDDTARRNEYCLVGLIDDDPSLLKKVVHGHRVLGTLNDLPQLVRSKEINEILISTRLSNANKEKLLAIADEFNLKISKRVFSQTVIRDHVAEASKG